LPSWRRRCQYSCSWRRMCNCKTHRQDEHRIPSRPAPDFGLWIRSAAPGAGFRSPGADFSMLRCGQKANDD
jgi:hypothetical protein